MPEESVDLASNSSIKIFLQKVPASVCFFLISFSFLLFPKVSSKST